MNVTATPLDHMHISGVVAALAHSQDDKDWQTFHDLFADRVTLDLSGQSGEPAADMTADDVTAKARSALDGFASTHHASSDLLVEVSGATGDCRAHMVAYHHLPAPGVDFCIMRGFWRLGLAKAGDRWVIRRWAVVRTAPWEGNPDIYRLASKGNYRVLGDPS